DRELRRRLVGGRTQRLTSAHIETRTMTNAFDLVFDDRTAGQLATIVRADVFDCIDLAVDIEHRDRRIAIPAGLHFAGQQFSHMADAYPVTHERTSTSSLAATISQMRRTSPSIARSRCMKSILLRILPNAV